MKSWIKYVFMLCVLTSSSQELVEKLQQDGFENIQTLKRGDSLFVSYEYREFRNPAHSMELAKDLLKFPDTARLIFFAPRFHTRPVGLFSADGRNINSNDGILKELNGRFNIFKDQRLNLRLSPEVVSRFGYYSDPFETKFNMILDTRIYLARGLSLQTGLTIPISNNLDNNGMKLRVAPTMLHYFAQPYNSHFIGISVGSFYRERYGLDMQYRYDRLDTPWSFGLSGGLTGFLRVYGREYYSEPLDDLYAVADVEWRTGIEHTSLKLSAGQFLYQDRGVRVDLIKQFEKAEIGFYAGRTSMGASGGFQFAFSLFPGKIFRTKHVELRTTEEFRWAYAYSSGKPVARRFQLGIPRLDDMLRNYNEAWMTKLLRK